MTVKQTPDDFRVQEVLTEDLLQAVRQQAGGHALYRLDKRNLTTHEALELAARSLHVRLGGFHTAGLKDKHAQTSQFVTVAGEGMAGAAPETLSGQDWQMQRVGYLDEPITSAAIAANRFEIVLTDLTTAAATLLRQRYQMLLWPPAGGSHELLFVNYFGEQRFGSARHGQGFLAWHLIKGQFEQAMQLAIATPSRQDRRQDKRIREMIARHWGQWDKLLPRLPRCPERPAVEELARGGDFRRAFRAMPYLFQQLTLEAYQSHLWNLTARAFLRQVLPGVEFITVPTPYAKLPLPPTAAVGAELAEMALPLLRRNSPLEEPWAAAAKAVLDKHEITTHELQIPGLDKPYFGKGQRRLFIAAREVTLVEDKPTTGTAGEDRKLLRCRLSFSLPRGAYATVLLRALGQ
jgi:tRNA pseudouridine13 synthase